MKTVLCALWMICATLALTWLWGGNPDAVPRPPVSVAIWLSDVYGAKDGEDLGRLEVLYMLAVSFVVVAGGTWLIRAIWRNRRRP
jgi:hypothetical protein